MPTHVTARLAWHNDGWNGAICRRPELNSYCVGCKSFPGDVISRERNLDLEKIHAGKMGNAIEGYVPPCSYSYNAFGLEEAPSASNPPDFFFGGAGRAEWTLPPATVSIWPYEAMYADEVKAEGFLDNNTRRKLTLEFFKPIQDDVGSNLIFYYANYSNPLSEDDAPRYAIIGASRILKLGAELLYSNPTEDVQRKFAGGMVWARDVTSAYPDEGVRLPYHRYLDDPHTLAEIAVLPENSNLCKYGSKHVSDDEAIGLLEQLLAKVRFLIEMNDQSEDWSVRESWLLKTIAELWKHRGLYPGLLRALEAAGATALVDRVKKLAIEKGSAEAHAQAFAFLDAGTSNNVSAGLDMAERSRIARNWKLQADDARLLLRDVLPRFDLSAEAMSAIASDGRDVCGLAVSGGEIAANPYLLCESYCGESPDDRLAWSRIDRGVLPAPEVGGKPLSDMELNDARRFRALCVDQLRQESTHTFRFAKDVLVEIAQRMGRLPAWKQAEFHLRYFEVDAEFLGGALTLKELETGLAIYLKHIFEDEREIEGILAAMATRPDIDLRRPVTADDWTSWVYKSGSVLARKAAQAYVEATDEQAEICERLFRRPLAVVTGAAGTGKTTVIEALVRGVRRAEGEGASIKVLAPTGKAADRAREVFEKADLPRVETVTIHSFLASNGWLNENLTLKRFGGKRAAIGTLIIDETSMLDLELAATLFRAIDWNGVRRLILVGDAGQLPPIGRGRIFADLIKWLGKSYPDNLGRLQKNLRQLLNAAEGRGSAIVALSELFVVDDEDKDDATADNRATRPDQEELIGRIHAGGEVDKDLDVIFWNEPSELAPMLIDAMERRMRGPSGDPAKPAYKVWQEVLKEDPTAFQILTPHRAELHGVEALNEACQKHVSEYVISKVGAVDGITLNDKVIQYRNRPRSNPLWAYDAGTRSKVQVEVFNGEIGTVGAFGFDSGLWKTLTTGFGPRLKRFAVTFSRKPGLTVGYGADVPHGGTKFKLTESVEGNLELAYAVSIHKAQGSEFGHTFVVVPASGKRPVSAELIYTALTRANRHCTLLIERDINSLLDARRRENAQTPQINSSLFELHVAKAAFQARGGWYEAGKIHEALSGDMLRSKSEVIIANMLHERGIPFRYELPLFAGDGTLRLPDFTVTWAGKTYFWEHLGRLDLTEYASEWSKKKAWYERWFPGQLLTTEEGPHLSTDSQGVILELTA